MAGKGIQIINYQNRTESLCRALIIGAGGVGTVVTQKIAANPVFTDVMLASRTKSKCDAVAAMIGGDRVMTALGDSYSFPDLF